MIKTVRVLPVFILILMAFMLIINQKVALYSQAQAQEIGDNYYDEKKSIRWEDPKHLKIYVENYKDKTYLMKRVFDIWNNRVRVFNFYFVNDKTQANIVCGFVYKLDDVTAGVTQYKYKVVTDKKGNRKRVFPKEYQVEILIPYIKEGNVGNFLNDNRENYLTVILHEVGHALGITYHSNNPNDIMYPAANNVVNQGVLSQRDINTLKMIYAY